MHAFYGACLLISFAAHLRDHINKMHLKRKMHLKTHKKKWNSTQLSNMSQHNYTWKQMKKKKSLMQIYGEKWSSKMPSESWGWNSMLLSPPPGMYFHTDVHFLEMTSVSQSVIIEATKLTIRNWYGLNYCNRAFWVGR